MKIEIDNADDEPWHRTIDYMSRFPELSSFHHLTITWTPYEPKEA
jgi:hypothetical protein